MILKNSELFSFLYFKKFANHEHSKSAVNSTCLSSFYADYAENLFLKVLDGPIPRGFKFFSRSFRLDSDCQLDSLIIGVGEMLSS